MNIPKAFYLVKVFFLFSITSFLWAAETPTPTPTSTLSEKIKQLNSEMQKLSATLAQDRKQHAGVQEQLRKQELTMAAVNKEIQELNKKIALQEKEISELQEKENKLNNEIAQRQEHLAESIRALHATGQQPDLKLLLNQNDTVDFQRLLAYYQFFNQALQRQITELDEEQGQLLLLQEKISATKDELTAERAEQEQKQQQLKAEQKERNNLLASLQKSINTKDKELKELEASQKELQRVIAAAEAGGIPVNAGPFAQQQGKLPWPTNGKVTLAFGSYRSGTKLRYDGMFISAPAGQAVKAVYPGRVVYADWLRGYGLLVIIDHGNKYMSLYAHNDALTAQVGNMVKAGQQIATVGTTGGLRQSGLYFEIRQNGKPVNPGPWLIKK